MSASTPLSAVGRAVSSVKAHRVLIGVLLVPVLLGTLIVWSLGDRAEQVEQVPAAVVNLDKPVLKKGEKPIAAGRLLAAGLTSPAEADRESLGWQLTDAEDAARGLESGDYYAVLTVPKDFSQTLSRSLNGNDPEQAAITVRSLDASSTVVSEISEQVARISAERLGERVTTTYLNTVFGETDQLAGKLGEAADGADRLAEGTTQLGAGSEELATGLGELADGADRLATGSQKLSGGAGELADGTSRLATGARQLADGTQQLAGGLGALERRTDPLPSQTDRLADGAADIARGVDGYSKLLLGWSEACKDPIIAARAARLCVATERAVGVDGSRAREFSQGAQQLADGTRQLADGMPELTGAIDQAAGGAAELATGADRLADGTQKLATGAAEVADGAAKLSEGAGRLAEGAGQASDGAGRLADGTAELGSGSEELADGLQRGADAIPVYDDEERRDLAGVIAEPVAAEQAQDRATPDGRTQVAPGAIAFALWLGAFVTFLMRPALPERLLRRASSASRLAGGGLLPAVLVGAAQAVLLFVALLALGADPAAPGATLLLMLVASAAFAAVNQAFVAVLGRRRGWLWTIAFTGVQVVSLGGVIPLDTAPWPLQLLNGALPVPSAANGLTVTVLDGPGSVAAAVAVLVAWALAGFVATVLAARRAQQVDVEELMSDQPDLERVR